MTECPECGSSVLAKPSYWFPAWRFDCGSSHDYNKFYLSENCLHRQISNLKSENKQLQATFDLRWKADMRAIKMWQERTGKTMEWADHADLVCFLLASIDRLVRHGETAWRIMNWLDWRTLPADWQDRASLWKQDFDKMKQLKEDDDAPTA